MDVESLTRALPEFAKLVIGNIADTVPEFLGSCTEEAPIGFIAVDVDYYSSAKKSLSILTGPPTIYLPIVPVYLDDIGVESSNPWTGELLAVNEFNNENELRKIAPFTLLRSRRILKNTQWIDRMFAAHITITRYDRPHADAKSRMSSQMSISIGLGRRREGEVLGYWRVRVTPFLA